MPPPRSTLNHSSGAGPSNVTEDVLEPLLEDSDTASTDSDSTRIRQESEEGPKMRFFDNLRGWDRAKRFRYFTLLALSLSGDGWWVTPYDCDGTYRLTKSVDVQVLRSRRNSLNLPTAGVDHAYGLHSRVVSSPLQSQIRFITHLIAVTAGQTTGEING